MFCQIGHFFFLSLSHDTLASPLPVWPLGWAVLVHCGNSDSRHTNHRGWTDNSAVVQPHTPCCCPRLLSLHVNRVHWDIRSFDIHVLIGLSLSVCQMHRQGAPSGYWQINDSELNPCRRETRHTGLSDMSAIRISPTHQLSFRLAG